MNNKKFNYKINFFYYNLLIFKIFVLFKNYKKNINKFKKLEQYL